ncbi:hypothetical protein N8977_00100 [Alphaproteobacteria bacterium]|nr:hypothetical protein [Alphaproteobacteria bacterium]
MVFNPTRQRQYKIRPVGIASMGGLRQLGDSFNQAGDSIREVVAENYKSDIENVEYEIATRATSTGAIIDEKTGRLKPFAPAAIDDLVSGLKKSDAIALRRNYDTATKALYASKVYNDATQGAAAALLENKDNPGAIQAAMIKSIERHSEGSDPDLIAAIKPEIVRAYGGSINKAQINLRLRQNGEAKTALETANVNFTNELATLAASQNMGSDDFESEQNIISQMNDIRAKRAALFDIAKDAGIVDDEYIKSSNIVMETAIGTRVAINNMDRSIAAGASLLDLHNLIDGFQKANVNETGFDANVVAQNMRVHLQNHSQGISLERSAENIRKKNNFTNAQGNIDNLSIDQINAMAFNGNIDGGQKYALTQMKTGLINSQKAADDAADRQNFGFAFNGFEFGDDVQKRSAENTIIEMIKSGTATYGEVSKYYGLKDKRINELIRTKNKLAVSQLKVDMSDVGGYLRTPQYYKQLEKELLASGLVSDDSKTAGMTIETWDALKIQYAKDYVKQDGINKKTREIFNNARVGILPDPEAVAHMRKYGYEPTTLVGTNTPIDINNENPTTAEESLSQVINYSIANGYFHKAIEPLITNFTVSDDNDYFAKGVSVFAKFYETAKDKGLNRVQIQGIYENSKGLNFDLAEDSMVYPINIVQSIGQKRLLKDKSSINRVQSKLIPEDSNETEFFDKNFRQAFTNDEDLVGFLTNHQAFVGAISEAYDLTDDYEVSQGHKNIIEQIKREYNTSSIGNIILDNPTIKSVIMQSAYDIVNNEGVDATERGFQTAIRTAVINMGDNIGIAPNEDGKLEFVLFPALKAAQKTVGMRPITIRHNDLVQDLKDRTDFKNAAFSQEQLEAIDKGNIVFVANRPYGKNNSYTAMIKMADETFVKLHTNYKYDFKTSKQNDVFQAVEKDLKDNPSLYRVLLNTNIFAESAVESYYDRMNNAQQRRSVITDMVNEFRRIGSNIQFNSGMPNFDPDKLTDVEMEKFFNILGGVLGHRAFPMDEQKASDLGLQ